MAVAWGAGSPPILGLPFPCINKPCSPGHKMSLFSRWPSPGTPTCPQREGRDRKPACQACREAGQG